MAYRVYFNGVDASGNPQLWVTDGTVAGTTEIIPSSGSYAYLNPTDITALSGTTLFNGLDSGGNAQLWATNGTSAGTVALTPAGAGSGGLAPSDIAAFGTGALFAGTDANGVQQLWGSDGTTAGTKELTPGGGGSSGVAPVSITVLSGGHAVFNGFVSDGNPGDLGLAQLFATDGTAAGTVALAVGGANSAGLNPNDLTALGSGALFFGLDQTGSVGLWDTDGTAAHTTEVAVEAGPASGLTVLGTVALFADGQSQLAVTNGTAAGTSELTNVSSGSGLNPTDITALGTKALFAGTDAAGLTGLWVSDGSAAGTQELVAGAAGVGGINPTDITMFGARALFSGVDGGGRTQLWITDGTTAGTTEILAAGASAAGLLPNDITAIGGQALFNGTDANGVQQLWSTDGSTGGTVPVNTTGLNPADLTVAGVASTLTLSAPPAATVGVGQHGALGTLTLTASGTAPDDLFTVTLNDNAGVFAATGGVVSNGGKTIVLTGSLAHVNSALASVTDTEPNAGADTVLVDAFDRNGVHAAEAKIAVTANTPPAITAPVSAGVGQGQPTPIPGVSVTETGNTTGETFTVKLADGAGLLAATGAGVSGSGSTALTITGSLNQVNADLATLTDTDNSTAADHIALTATDSLGNTAPGQSIAISVSARPVFTAPASVAVGVNKAQAITGVSLSETNAFAGETFTATVTDTNGILSVTGAGTVLNNGSKGVILRGTLAQVNALLATLSDTDGTTGADTIQLNAQDSLGNTAVPSQIAVTVDGLPVFTAPSALTVNQAQSSPLAGISLSESPNSTGETFTATVSDTAGLLSANGAGVSGAGTKQLTITGTLGQVNTALASLTDTDTAATPDTLTLQATDSFGNKAAPASVALTVVAVVPPKITGTAGGQKTTDERAIKPFAGVTITDASSGPPTETVTVTPGSTANGALSDPNAATDGGAVLANGSYRVSGSAAAVTAALDGLVFTPIAHEVSPGSSVTTGFTITDTNSLNATSTDAAASVVATAVNDAPVVTGLATVNTTDEAAVSPFAGVAVTDPDLGITDTVTVTLSGGDANGKLSGTGITKTGTGTYSVAAGTPASVTTTLRGAVFTPTAHQVSPGTAVTTTFTLADTQTSTGGAAAVTTTATSAVVATAVNDAPVITGTKAGQATVDYVPINPFATAAVSDPDANAQVSLTIDETTSTGAISDANGRLSGGGIVETTTPGVYTLAATSPASLSTELKAVTFTPAQAEVGAGQTVTTGFTLIATQNGAGGTHTSTTDKTTSVTVTALNYIYGPTCGGGLIFGTTGDDVITAYAQYNAIFADGGNDFILAGNGFAAVNVCTGNASVVLGGSNNLVTGIDGNDTVTGGSGGANAVFLGNGNDVVTVGGQYDNIKLGNGKNWVSGTQGMAFITTGSGNDTIILGGSGSTVNAGAGSNTITGGTGNDTFILPAAGQGFDTIAGFSETNGDILDLKAALAATGWNDQPQTLGNYLKVTSSGGSTTLSIASGGSGPGTAVALLSGAGNLGLSDLLSHNSLRTF